LIGSLVEPGRLDRRVERSAVGGCELVLDLVEQGQRLGTLAVGDALVDGPSQDVRARAGDGAASSGESGARPSMRAPSRAAVALASARPMILSSLSCSSSAARRISAWRCDTTWR
jgi:hypothetical protein